MIVHMFQKGVWKWMLDCFGEPIATSLRDRNHRFLEEALELVQATGCTSREAHQLVDYVFGRLSGEVAQEVGGVMVTLAALCTVANQDMGDCGEAELERVWANIAKIRAKQAAKPANSPLPGATVSKLCIVSIARNGKWVQVASFERACEAICILPALAAAYGAPVRCTSDETIHGFDVPRGVSFEEGQGRRFWKAVPR